MSKYHPLTLAELAQFNVNFSMTTKETFDLKHFYGQDATTIARMTEQVGGFFSENQKAFAEVYEQFRVWKTQVKICVERITERNNCYQKLLHYDSKMLNLKDQNANQKIPRNTEK